MKNKLLSITSPILLMLLTACGATLPVTPAPAIQTVVASCPKPPTMDASLIVSDADFLKALQTDLSKGQLKPTQSSHN
jgi:hypothetical protein